MIISKIRLGTSSRPRLQPLYYVQTEDGGLYVKAVHPHAEFTSNLEHAQGYFSKPEAEEVVDFLQKHFNLK